MMTTSNLMSSRTESSSEPFSSPSRINHSPSSHPRHPTSFNSYREMSHSHSSPPPTMALPISIPPSNSPVMPFLPNLSGPSNSFSMSPSAGGVSHRWSITSEEKAMDSAMAAERARIKELEKKESEADLTVEDLKLILKRERSRSSKLVGELAAMKSMSVASQAEAEIGEEGRINGLMRRLDCLQKEKGRIIVELEREEEMVGVVWHTNYHFSFLVYLIKNQSILRLNFFAHSWPIHFKRNWMK